MHSLLITLVTGMFWPRLPKGILKVDAPAAVATNWLPMQIPKSGLQSSDSIIGLWEPKDQQQHQGISQQEQRAQLE